MNLRRSDVYQKGVEYLVLATLIGVPLFYDTSIYLTFDLSKALLLKTLTLLILWIWLGRLILLQDRSFTRTPLDAPILLFFVMSILSAVFSVSPWVSFLGTYRRFEGVVTISCYIILFYSVVNIIEHNRVFIFFKTIVAVGAVAALYAIYQAAGGEEGKWLVGTIPISTFGNQNFLAAYLVMAIPLSVVLCLSEDKKREKHFKLFWAVAFLSMAFALLLTKTRGAWVGFSVGILIFIALAGKHILEKREAKIGGLIILVASLLLCLNPRTSPINRILGTFKITEGRISLRGSALERLYIWQAGIKTMLHYPLTGCGIEAMRLAYCKFEPKELEIVGGHNVKADRSHNETIDMGVTRGIPGLIIYIWLWISIGVLILRIRRRDRILSAGLGSAFSAYFVQNQFNFSMVSYTTTFWVLLALSCIVLRRDQKRPYLIKSISINQWAIFGISSGIILLLLASSIPIYIADRHFKEAVTAKEAGQWDRAIEWAEKAISTHPKEVYYYETLCEALFYKAQSLSGERQREYVKRCFDAANRALSITPTNGFFYNLLGGLHTLLYFAGEEAEAELAIADYKKALELMPIFTEAYMNMAVIYKRKGEIKQAMDCYDKILEINPEHISALVNLADLYYYQLREPKRALVLYERAEKAADKKARGSPKEKDKALAIKEYASSMAERLR